MIPNKISNILEDIYTGDTWNDIVINLLSPNENMKFELLSEIAISFYSTKEKVEKAHREGWLKYYFVTACSNQIKSNTSRFHKNCRMTLASELEYNPKHIVDDELQTKIDLENSIERLNIAKEKVKFSWLESEIFKLYFDDNMSLRKVASELGLSHVFIWQKVNKIKDKINKKL
jgi:DNA-directed RNA polymerase specialized sigma subunit